MTSQDATKAHGWGISLRYRGRTLRDLRVGDARPLRAGEAADCELVVPGLGEAAVLAEGAVLARVAGLGGEVRCGEEVLAYGEWQGLALAPGDRATLHLEAHPEITLELRREAFERLPLGTLIHVRELARQLALGVGLIAGLALLIHNEVPVNALEVKGDPDAPDSELVRAMFIAAAEAPQIPLHAELPWLQAPPAPAPIEPQEPALPMPMLLAAETPVPVPVAEVDVQPNRSRRRARAQAKVVSTLDSFEYAALDTLQGGVEGGVVGGVLGGTVGADVLAELREEAPALAMIGRIDNDGDEVAIGALKTAGGPELADVVDVVDVVDIGVPVGGGGIGYGGIVVPEPVPTPPPVGLDSHDQAGAELAHGVMNGLAAVAPEARCEDPSQTPRSQLDIVFVVDVSTTMAFMLDRIEQQLASVDAEARAQGLDARYGLVVFVDDVLLANNGQPYADLTALRGELAGWQRFTAGNRQIGSEALNLDWPENTLDAVHAAATGFAWRPADTTLRLIVHATDDDFGEAPAIQSGQAVQHSYRQTITALRAAQVRLFSFAAKVGGECECLDVRPGLFTRFHGRPSLPNATGGAVFDIDEVARGKLSFVAAVAGALKSGVCSAYPPAPGRKP